MNRRNLILAGALTLVIMIRVVDPWKKGEPIAVVASTIHAKRSGSVSVDPPPSTLPNASWHARVRANDDAIDPFAAPKPPEVSVIAAPPAPAPAPPAPPPPPPSAPPLPFTAIGDWTESGQTVAFLSGSNGLFMAAAGQTLIGLYHVDQVSPGHATLTYMPLKQVQQMTWSSSR